MCLCRRRQNRPGLGRRLDVRPPPQHRHAPVPGPLGELVGEVRAVRVARRAAGDDEAGGLGIGEVDHLPVHRQRGHGERAALAPAVAGGLDGVGVAAHAAPRAAPAGRRAGAPPGLVLVAPPPLPGVAGLAGRLQAAASAAGSAARTRSPRAGSLSPPHRAAEQFPGVVAEPAPDQGASGRASPRPSTPRSRRRAPGGTAPRRAPAGSTRRAAPGRLRGQFAVPAGQQRRAPSAVLVSGPSPASSRAQAWAGPGNRVRLHAGQLLGGGPRRCRPAATGAARPATAGRTCRRCTARRRR